MRPNSLSLSLHEQVHVRGMIYGDRFFEYDGMMLVRDKKNDLQARIQFKTDLFFPKSGGWFSMRKKVPTDYFKGSITSLSDPRKIHSVVEGSWVGAVEFDGKPYWDWKQSLEKAKPTAVEKPLPSDSRYREDLVHLAAGKREEAGEWKYRLEQAQRADRELRAEGRGLRAKQALAAEAKKLGITVAELEARKSSTNQKSSSSSWW
jgi:Oxysterol-binding protein